MGAAEIPQAKNLSLVGNLSSGPALTLGSSESPVTPAPGGPTFSSALHRHMHTYVQT